MIKLSKRLKTIADMCGHGRGIADVGCDHAYIPIFLIQNGRFEHASAIDVNAGPLNGAEKNARSEYVYDKMDFCLSDGLVSYPEELDDEVLLIAGMGGRLMAQILAESEKRTEQFERFVFSPHSELAEFRYFAGTHGICIDAEQTVSEDGKQYTVISAVHGSDSCTDECEHEYGKASLQKDPAAYGNMLEKNLEIYSKLLNGKCHLPDERRSELERAYALNAEAVRRYEMQRDNRKTE